MPFRSSRTIHITAGHFNLSNQHMKATAVHDIINRTQTCNFIMFATNSTAPPA